MNTQHFIWLYHYLWIAPHVLLVVVAALMFRKGLHKDYPLFFAYLLFEFLQFCVLFSLRFTKGLTAAVYMEIDMFGRGGSIALRFGIFREMFESALAHSVHLRQGMARILNWVTAALVILAAVFIGSLYYSMLGHRAAQAYLTSEVLNTAQCGLLVLVFLWYRFLGLRMSSFVFGIALGIGLASGFDPLILALKGFLPAHHSNIVDILQMAVYHCAVLIWLCFALVREKTAPNHDVTPLPVASELSDLGRIIQL